MALVKSTFKILFCIALFVYLSQQQVINVAVGKPADQNATLEYNTFNWTADKAVDGRLERDDPNNQRSCSASMVEQGQESLIYWRVNLIRQYEVVGIYIYPRTDQGVDNQLNGFELHIKEEANGQEIQITDTPAFDNDIYAFHFSPSRIVTEVIIRRPGETIMVICEAQVSAVCDDGFYGENCSSICGGCLNNAACNKTSGVCQDGCESGYYGENCVRCGNCLNDEACNSMTGTCPSGCAAGWRGDMCDQACENGTFGINCNQTCGNCLDTCNIVNGSCSSTCQAGWQGDMCMQECSNNMYGMNCSITCGNCLNEVQCNHINGTCFEGCDPGWQGNTCLNECSNNTFGSNCAMKCGNCLNGSQCLPTNGTCMMGCDPGWTGGMCLYDTSSAKEKPAFQSTTLFSNGFHWNASFAVDGDNRQVDSETSMTCSSTANETSVPWWYVDMELITAIDSIFVYGQKDYPSLLSGFLLYLSNNTNFTDNPPKYTQAGNFGDGVFNIDFAGVLARYVYITLPNPGQLSICEFRILGECQDGMFGEECQNTCHCANGIACDKTSGECPDGACEPGWVPTQCSQPCRGNTYGSQCSEPCGHCANNEACDVVNGTCYDGCNPGWVTELCTMECEANTYGQDCNSTCGNCKDDMPCNHIDGSCNNGCAAGYQGTTCHDEYVVQSGVGGMTMDNGRCQSFKLPWILRVKGAETDCQITSTDHVVKQLQTYKIAVTQPSSRNGVGSIHTGIFGGLAFLVFTYV